MMSPARAGTARQRVIAFTRFPLPGQTKTRLIPALGEEGAALLQRRLTEHTLDRLANLPALDGIRLEIRFDERATTEQMRQWLAPDCDAPVEAIARALRQSDPVVGLMGQGAGDLGQRMLRAFEQASSEGISATVIVGIDTPALDATHVRQALVALGSRDVVLGPATDGGYYLIGLARPAPSLLRAMPWGSGEVLRTTLDRIETAGLTVDLLQELSDIDRPADLMLLREFADLRRFAPPAEAPK